MDLIASRLALISSLVLASGCSSQTQEAGSSATETSTSQGATETSGEDPTETTGEDSTETTGDGDGDPCDTGVEMAVTLERLLSSGALPSPLPTMDTAPLAAPDNSSVGSDDRIYLVVDQDLGGQTFTTEFSYLTVDLNGDSCALNLALDLFELEQVVESVVDLSVGRAAALELSATGVDGLNVWDITDIELQDDNCATSPQTSISYSPDGGPYDMLWNHTGVDSEVRSVAIYAGKIAEACF